MTSVNIKEIASSALSQSQAILSHFLPGGKLSGREYQCGSLTGGPGDSCSTNTVTGRWSDFATGEAGGDLVALVAAIRKCSQLDAAKELAGFIGHSSTSTEPRKAPDKPIWTPIVLVPTDAPPAPTRHYQHGEPVAVYPYPNQTGQLMQIIHRYEFPPDTPGEKNKKLFSPLTFCRNESTGKTDWRFQALPDNRPLYGLDRLADDERLALVVEGEKAAEAARRIIGNRIKVLTWSGGSNAVFKTDWGPLKGFRVCIWPDADKAGIKAALAVADAVMKAGAESVRIVLPPDVVVEGFDLADAEAEGWTRDKTMELLKAGVTPEEFKRLKIPDAEEPPPIEDAFQQPPPQPFDLSRLIRGRELKAGDYSVTFVVDKLIPENSIILFYAKGGSGKSTLATQIAAAVESGSRFMGLNTLRRPVVVIDWENPVAVLHNRIKGIEGADDVFFWTGSENPPQLNKAGWTQFKDLITTLGNPLIFIDTLSSSCSGLDILNNGDFSPVMQRIIELRNMGATIVLLHHTPKQDETKYIGASCIYNQVDHVLAMYPVKTTGQDKEVVDEDEAKVYRFGTKDKTRFGHFVMHVEFDDEKGGFVIAADPDRDILYRLHKLITDHPGINQTGIKNQINLAVAKDKLKRLLKHNEGRLWKIEPGLNNSKLYYPISVDWFSEPIGAENRETESEPFPDTGKPDTTCTPKSDIKYGFAGYSAPPQQTGKPTDIEDAEFRDIPTYTAEDFADLEAL